MKKVFICCIIFILCVTSLSLASADTTNGLFTYKLKGNGNAVITGFNWSSNNGNDIYIPRQIDGYTVSEIGAYAFSGQNLSFGDHIGQSVVVVIPDTVTMIGEKAFFCSNINTVSIPTSVEYIGDGAFAGCVNIKEHYVQSGNNSYATINGYLYNKSTKELVSAPAGKEYTNTISIPDGIVSIGPYAFYGLSITLKGNQYGSKSSQLVSFPPSLKTIKAYAFAYTTLNGTAYSKGNIPANDHEYDTVFSFENIEEIGDYTFYNSTWESLIPNFDNNALRIIGKYSFSNVSHKGTTVNYRFNTKNTLTLPATLEEIGEGAFDTFYSSMLPVDVFDLSATKLDTIPENAFHKCNVKESILLPKSIKHIGKNAFSEIGSLSGGTIYEKYSIEIEIPSGVQTIEEKAFSYSNLSLSFEKTSKLISIGEKAFYASMLWPVGYPSGKTITIPDGVQSIGSEAFNMYGDFIISIPSSVTSIGENVTDRTSFKLQVVPGSYAAVYASENGYLTVGDEDTSWLNN